LSYAAYSYVKDGDTKDDGLVALNKAREHKKRHFCEISTFYSKATNSRKSPTIFPNFKNAFEGLFVKSGGC